MSWPTNASGRLSVHRDAQSPECDAVRTWLGDYNRALNPAFMQQIATAEYAPQPLVILAHEHDRVVGGLFAETQLAWLKIAIMAVDPQRRRQGIGAALLLEAERIAVARGCLHAYVDTMSYQAPQFYRSHGYAIVGELADWDSHGHSKLFLVKRWQPLNSEVT